MSWLRWSAFGSRFRIRETGPPHQFRPFLHWPLFLALRRRAELPQLLPPVLRLLDRLPIFKQSPICVVPVRFAESYRNYVRPGMGRE